jgi:hypothetical protein
LKTHLASFSNQDCYDNVPGLTGKTVSGAVKSVFGGDLRNKPIPFRLIIQLVA